MECFKVISRRRGEYPDMFNHIRLVDEVFVEPKTSWGMWAGVGEETQGVFLAEQDGSWIGFIMADSWEQAKEIFRNTYPGVSENNGELECYVNDNDEDMNLFWQCQFPSELEL